MLRPMSWCWSLISGLIWSLLSAPLSPTTSPRSHLSPFWAPLILHFPEHESWVIESWLNESWVHIIGIGFDLFMFTFIINALKYDVDRVIVFMCHRTNHLKQVVKIFTINRTQTHVTRHAKKLKADNSETESNRKLNDVCVSYFRELAITNEHTSKRTCMCQYRAWRRWTTYDRCVIIRRALGQGGRIKT